MADENLVKISDLPLGHRTDLEGSFVPVALPNQQTYKVPLEEFTDPLEIMVAVYGTTSMEAVITALSAGKTIFAARQVSSVTRLAPLTDHATGAYHFVWQNSDGTRELWELTSTGWTEEALDFTIIAANTSIAGSTPTVSIEQGDLCIVDLTEETSLTAVEIVLTNNATVTFPLWWFKIESGSSATLSVKIGAVAVGWLGSETTNIEPGKTIEVSVVDGIACGGELV